MVLLSMIFTTNVSIINDVNQRGKGRKGVKWEATLNQGGSRSCRVHEPPQNDYASSWIFTEKAGLPANDILFL